MRRYLWVLVLAIWLEVVAVAACGNASPQIRANPVVRPYFPGEYSLVSSPTGGLLLFYIDVPAGEEAFPPSRAKELVWKLDGTDAKWYQVSNSSFEQPVIEDGATLDPAAHDDLLFGGTHLGTPHPLAETWLWNGRRWLHPLTTTVPDARICPALAYDPALHGVVMFGGVGLGNSEVNDTWIWNGTSWVKLPEAVVSKASGCPSMAYDASAHQLVLLTGESGITQTWIMAGSEVGNVKWVEVNGSEPPGGTIDASAAYDESSGTVVLAGGHSTLESTPFASVKGSSSTWTWNPGVRGTRNVGWFDQVSQASLSVRSSAMVFGQPGPVIAWCGFLRRVVGISVRRRA